MTRRERWWHAYGAEVPGLARDAAGAPAPAWCLVIAGEADLPPDAEPVQRPLAHGGVDLPYLASWRHEPSAAEKEAVTPPAYRDA